MILRPIYDIFKYKNTFHSLSFIDDNDVAPMTIIAMIVNIILLNILCDNNINNKINANINGLNNISINIMHPLSIVTKQILQQCDV